MCAYDAVYWRIIYVDEIGKGESEDRLLCWLAGCTQNEMDAVYSVLVLQLGIRFSGLRSFQDSSYHLVPQNSGTNEVQLILNELDDYALVAGNKQLFYPAVNDPP
jgi:hypothetical protein